ncbi:MAG TPA: type IV toxin-antitoxin system AbiEi family antitoxin domain-containing protein [Baekduia sp.]|nr:type IV toxin-antitoxin system AbiEi family antitoxin domain-containing protein [Baekduia sp.]
MGDKRAEEIVLRELVARQHGVVTRAQLLALGLGAKAVAYRVRTGRLVRLHAGVYAAGHRELRPEGFWLGAVLSCGPRAVLGAAAAGAAWDIRPSRAVRVDVVMADDHGRRRRDVRLLRRPDLRPDERTQHRGIPITTVERTLLDLATVVDRVALREAFNQASVRRLLRPAALARVLDGRGGRPGVPALQALADEHARHGTTLTRSNAEARMLQLCVDFGLPRPEVNRRAHGRTPDFRWPDHHLIVEIDSHAWHGDRLRFSADRARNRHHVLHGAAVVAYTANDLVHRPAHVADELRRLLALSSPAQKAP